MNNPAVYFIGAGPGDPGLLTLRGHEIITQADLVLYAGSLVPRQVVTSARPEAQVIDSAPLDLDQTHALMRDTALAGGLVARVHTGEPSLYGSMREQMALLDADGISYAVIPGVTAAFATAAKACASFTVPEITQTLIITRLAGRTPMPERERLRHLARHGASLAVYLSADKAAILARELREAGLAEDTTIILGHKIGHAQEKLVRATLATLEAEARQHKMTRQTVFLVLPGEQAPRLPSRLYAPEFAHGFRAASRPSTWDTAAIYTLTSAGLKLAQRIATHLPSQIFTLHRLATEHSTGFERIADQLRSNFSRYHAHICIAATGIVVRAIAPLLDSKTTDPAVLVCDQNGQHVISLLAGHLGGANDLARRIAAHLGAVPVLTTATDNAGTICIETLAKTHGCHIANPEGLVAVNAALVQGTPVPVYDPEHRLPTAQAPEFVRVASPEQALVVVSWQALDNLPGLVLRPPCLVVGIGCRKGVTHTAIITALHELCAMHGLAQASISTLASVDIKEQEPGLHQAATSCGLPLVFFTRSDLAAIPTPTPSATVQDKIGVPSVCEAAALKAAQTSTLLVPKTIFGPITLAVALAPSQS
ncbi:MAG: precorrin-4 C(11)-methyltransferase [Desulfovibrionales bacterium]|nr:precorrin-4 C(11)-methyltransferase [Desulfovibrionales bacterium]